MSLPASTAVLPNPGEITLKEFVLSEAERRGITYSGVFMRIKRGLYPRLRRRYVNSRVVFVKLQPQHYERFQT